jgi:hypothetical protein
MSRNKKQPSPEVVRLAVGILADSSASKEAKSLAGSVVAQAHTDKQTGAELETIASRVLKSDTCSADVKTLAASVLAQSNKER